MIRHAGLRLALPVGVLTVAMILPSLLTLLEEAVVATRLLRAGLAAASRTAIAMPAITGGAEIESRQAFIARAIQSSENYFAVSRHACSQAGLDKGKAPWQVRNS